MHGSTYIDSDHHGRAARLNGPHSWTPDPLKDVHGNAPYLVINLVASGSSRNAGYKIHGISTQGDPVFQTWVTKFTMETTIKSKEWVYQSFSRSWILINPWAAFTTTVVTSTERKLTKNELWKISYFHRNFTESEQKGLNNCDLKLLDTSHDHFYRPFQEKRNQKP